jgi:hypothetical protein
VSTPTLQIQNVTTNHVGIYTVRVSNHLGHEWSRRAPLELLVATGLEDGPGLSISEATMKIGELAGDEAEILPARKFSLFSTQTIGFSVSAGTLIVPNTPSSVGTKRYFRMNLQAGSKPSLVALNTERSTIPVEFRVLKELSKQKIPILFSRGSRTTFLAERPDIPYFLEVSPDSAIEGGTVYLDFQVIGGRGRVEDLSLLGINATGRCHLSPGWLNALDFLELWEGTGSPYRSVAVEHRAGLASFEAKANSTYVLWLDMAAGSEKPASADVKWVLIHEINPFKPRQSDFWTTGPLSRSNGGVHVEWQKVSPAEGWTIDDSGPAATFNSPGTYQLRWKVSGSEHFQNVTVVIPGPPPPLSSPTITSIKVATDGRLEIDFTAHSDGSYSSEWKSVLTDRVWMQVGEPQTFPAGQRQLKLERGMPGFYRIKVGD